jgi:hypothetical protein
MTVCSDLRLSLAKTLAQRTAATLHVGRVSPAAIGRQRASDTSAEHKIQRTWRLTGNRRIVIGDATRGVIARLCKRRKRKPLVGSPDWTDIRSFQTLVAAAVVKGRAVPLSGASYAEWELLKSRNAPEEGLPHLPHTLTPEGVRVILPADRGFGRAEMARARMNFRFRYLIRTKPDAWIEHPTFQGELKNYPVAKGRRRVPRATGRRRSRWYLMTDLGGSALSSTAL